MAVTKDERGFSLYPAYREFLLRLSDAERGQLLMALFDFHEGVDTSSRLSDGARMAFAFISGRMTEDARRYRKRCEANRENASKRWPVRESTQDDAEEDG